MVHSQVVPSTVLIAPSEHLSTLRARPDLADTTAFADTEALRALDTITRQRPAVVALERMFASTSRGAALINRIKADPSLSGCEIRIVTPGLDDSTIAASAVTVVEETGAGLATATIAPAVATPPAPLDRRGTRRAPRVVIMDDVEVFVDGNPATLVDLSALGAQVVSATILKPNQRLRMLLPDTSRPIRFNAAVAWAAFEMPKSGPRYRAGIEFVDADPDAVGRFAELNKK